MLAIKELRAQTGLSQSKFANKFNIKVKTLQCWELGKHNTPPHIISMIERILYLEQLCIDNGIDIGQEDCTANASKSP
jgi:transcriptional regulator with XRE-family HTH domain